MTYADALKRLAGCRAAQPDVLQVIVSADIVDALLKRLSGAERPEGMPEVAPSRPRP